MEERPWFKHYDSGVPQHIDFPKVTLFHLLEETTRKYPNQPCAIFKGQVVTYAEMNALERSAGGRVGGDGRQEAATGWPSSCRTRRSS